LSVQTVRNPSSRKRLTYQDLLGLPEDLLRHELIDGEHLMSPAPNSKHQRVVVNLAWLIRAYLEDCPMGRVYVAPYDVVFSDFDVAEPDLLYVSAERERLLLKERCLAGAPDLVIEVLSPSTARIDAGKKRWLYGRYGVSEYWIVDPLKETIRVYRLADGLLQHSSELVRGDGTSVPSLSTPLLPGLEIPLATVFD
jgi:Uma2 family endonuclease